MTVIIVDFEALVKPMLEVMKLIVIMLAMMMTKVLHIMTATLPPEPQPPQHDDIYIMMSVCLSVMKNHHFLLGVSCNHPGWFFMVLGRFLWFFMVLGQVL